MKKKLKDCTIQELCDMCDNIKGCGDCIFDNYSLIPEEGGCPIYNLINLKYSNIEIDIFKKENN